MRVTLPSFNHRFLHLSLLAALAVPSGLTESTCADEVLVEAESFEEPGGWKLDTQFIEVMGSPYLLAHGLGKPVEDAAKEVRFANSGRFHVYVRTKDWVANWKAKGI